MVAFDGHAEVAKALVGFALAPVPLVSRALLMQNQGLVREGARETGAVAQVAADGLLLFQQGHGFVELPAGLQDYRLVPQRSLQIGAVLPGVTVSFAQTFGGQGEVQQAGLASGIVDRESKALKV